MSAYTECMEPGRAMLHEHVGRWLVTPPDRPPEAPGTACTVCSQPGARLWGMDTGGTACIAQLAITAKRPGRRADGDPPPRPGDVGKFSLAEGAFALAGPDIAMVVTKLSPITPPPPRLRIVFPGERAVAAATRRLAEAPPPPPYVAVRFGKRANYPIAITAHNSRIILNGPDGFTLDGPQERAAMALVARLGPRRATELAALRQRLATATATGARQELDEAMFKAMRESADLTMAEFRGLPRPGSRAAMLMAAWAKDGGDAAEGTRE